ncbi:MAG: hypothetical protein ABJJ07_03300, partial [Maribacter dokdonensis]
MSAFNYKWILIVFVCFFLSCKNEETKPLLAINANDQSMFNNAIREHYFLALDSTSYYMQQIDTAQSLSKNKELFLKSRE